MGWPFDEIADAVGEIADVATDVAGGIAGAAMEAVTSIPVVGDVVEMAAPFAGMVGGMVGGPFGGMIGNAIETVAQGGNPFDVVDHALAAVAGGDFGGLASTLIGGDFGGLASSFLGGDVGDLASSILGGDVGALAQSAFGALGGGDAAGVFGSIAGAVDGLGGGDAGGLLGQLADFGAGSVFGAIPGGSLLDGWEGALQTFGGQLGDLSGGGGLLGTVLGGASDGFDLGDLGGLVGQLDGGLGGLGLGNLGGLGSQILEAATGGAFGAPDLGSFGSALEGLGVNVGALSGADDLVSNLTGGTAAQLVDQLSGAGSLDEFVGGLTAGGANALIDRVTDAGGGVDSLLGQLDGGGAQALLGKLAESGNLEQTLGQLGPEGMADLITKMVAPPADDALGALGIQAEVQATGAGDAAGARPLRPTRRAWIRPPPQIRWPIRSPPPTVSTPRRPRKRCPTRRLRWRSPSRSPTTRKTSTPRRRSKTSATSSSSDAREPRSAPAMTDAGAPSVTVKSTIIELVKVLHTLDRQDLVDRATAAAARLERPGTIVCVVGEFKQGKSSLVNGLLGQAICPVDDDLATSAITLVRYGERGRRRSCARERERRHRRSSEPVPIDELARLGDRGRQPRQRASRSSASTIAVPSPLLEQGLVARRHARAWAASAPATPPRRWRSCRSPTA